MLPLLPRGHDSSPCAKLDGAACDQDYRGQDSRRGSRAQACARTAPMCGGTLRAPAFMSTHVGRPGQAPRRARAAAASSKLMHEPDVARAIKAERFIAAADPTAADTPRKTVVNAAAQAKARRASWRLSGRRRWRERCAKQASLREAGLTVPADPTAADSTAMLVSLAAHLLPVRPDEPAGARTHGRSKQRSFAALTHLMKLLTRNKGAAAAFVGVRPTLPEALQGTSEFDWPHGAAYCTSCGACARCVRKGM